MRRDAVALLEVSDLTFGYTDDAVFQNVTFRLFSGFDLYEGGFLDYVQMLARRQAAEARGQAPAGGNGPGAVENQQPARSPAAGGDKHRARREAARRLERQRSRVTELERAIAKREQELAELRQQLQASPGEDWERLHEWAKRERELSESVERLMTEWASVSDELATLDSLPEAEP